jgi:hypothetical protein
MVPGIARDGQRDGWRIAAKRIGQCDLPPVDALPPGERRLHVLIDGQIKEPPGKSGRRVGLGRKRYPSDIVEVMLDPPVQAVCERVHIFREF